MLHPLALMTGLAPCRQREGSQIVQRNALELDGFGIGHALMIQIFYMSAGIGMSGSFGGCCTAGIHAALHLYVQKRSP